MTSADIERMAQTIMQEGEVAEVAFVDLGIDAATYHGWIHDIGEKSVAMLHIGYRLGIERARKDWSPS